jgi:IMP dehydrogenase
MKIRPTKGLTYDDVLLVPRRSSIASRQDVDTSTRLTTNIRLNIPILSANMDTVTEAPMAIAMARAGGIGILHRFMTIEQQVKQVNLVKRAQGFMVETPYLINIDASLSEARHMLDTLHVGGLIVVDDDGAVAGMLTNRDVLIAPDSVTLVKEAMTERRNLVTANPDITPEEAQELLYRNRIEKLPILNEDGSLYGLVTARDVIKPMKFPLSTHDERERLRVGAAIGIGDKEMERAEAVLEANADVLVLDIAHGHSDHCINMLKKLRQRFPNAQIIAGNVASTDGARELSETGVDSIKVGIGPGSICTTRIVTGFGVPQLTAIIDSKEGVRLSGRDIPIIADGGIRASGDIVKALAAGAETVMLGSMFAGTEESPGSSVIRDGQKIKVVRGMASLGAALGRQAAENVDGESAEDQADWDKVVPEGVEAVVPYRGAVSDVLHQLVGGLRSGLSYGGANNILELQENAEFIEISPAGYLESGTHDVRKV